MEGITITMTTNKIEDFVSREEFIKRTGIFVTPEYFEYIYHKWVDETAKTGISVDDFVDDYEKNHIGQVAETKLNGTFKYLIMDESISCMHDDWDICDPDIWDIVNSLACDLAYEREEKQKAFEKAIEAMENVYADVEVIYKQALNTVEICKSLIDNNEEEFADFPKRDAFRRWRRS